MRAIFNKTHKIPRALGGILMVSAHLACGGGATPQPENPDSKTGSENAGPSDSGGSSDARAAGEAGAAGGGDTAGKEASPDEGAGAKKSAEATAEPASEAASLARDFLKTGGRRIGYSATKKMFAYPAEQRSETGFGLDIQFVGEDGKPRDAMRICQIGECEEHLDELSKELLPKLTSRLESDGYVSIRGIGWPQGRDELEVNSLSLKLKYSKGNLSVLKEGKPAARVSIQGGKRLSADTLLAVFIVPDTKWLPVFAPAGKDAKGQIQEFFVFKLP